MGASLFRVGSFLYSTKTPRSAIKRDAANNVDPFTLMTDRDKHFHENNKNRAASQNEFNWQPLYIKGAGLAPGMSCSGKAGFG